MFNEIRNGLFDWKWGGGVRGLVWKSKNKIILNKQPGAEYSQ